LDQSLTDEEYDRLAAVLRRFPSEDAMDLEEMDGFFAALICGPVTVLPRTSCINGYGLKRGTYG